jgi:hypothetical protein
VLATVVALYNVAGLTSLAPLGKEEEVLRKRVVLLVGAAVMVLSMLAAPAAFAQGTGECDPQPGQAEKSRSPQTSPPGTRPGELHTDSGTGGPNDPNNGQTGRGERCL